MQVFVHSDHKSTCILAQWCEHIVDKPDNYLRWQIFVFLLPKEEFYMYRLLCGKVHAALLL